MKRRNESLWIRLLTQASQSKGRPLSRHVTGFDYHSNESTESQLSAPTRYLGENRMKNNSHRVQPSIILNLKDTNMLDTVISEVEVGTFINFPPTEIFYPANGESEGPRGLSIPHSNHVLLHNTDMIPTYRSGTRPRNCNGTTTVCLPRSYSISNVANQFGSI